jgi:hypothetical protein
MENKKEIVLDILDKLSDLSFQEKVWIKQEYWDQVLNFGEAVNLLDDYSFFDEVFEGKIKFIETTEQNKLESFVKELEAYQEPFNPNDMLQDPRWRRISEQAAEIASFLLKNVR